MAWFVNPSAMVSGLWYSPWLSHKPDSMTRLGRSPSMALLRRLAKLCFPPDPMCSVGTTRACEATAQNLACTPGRCLFSVFFYTQIITVKGVGWMTTGPLLASPETASTKRRARRFASPGTLQKRKKKRENNEIETSSKISASLWEKRRRKNEPLGGALKIGLNRGSNPRPRTSSAACFQTVGKPEARIIPLDH